MEQFDKSKNWMGLRSIALFEASKGLLVLLVGFGIFSLAHRDMQVIGERIVKHLHLNPAHEIPQIFLHTLNRLENMNFVLLAFGALLYSAVRFIEAYGLWFDRAWAEWMAIVSTGLYLPAEFYEMWKKGTPVASAITILNVGLFIYLVKVRREKKHSRELLVATQT